jgi:predicted ATP-dependent endonuclease of OLD family
MREITSEAFGLYFVVDPTNIGNFRVRMSGRLPEDSSEEQSWDERAREFHKQASDIAELSDGVKAFTGLTAAVLSGDFRIILVDEPEAFLHPILAKQLGRRLTELASEREGNVLAATHSPDFLMGCIQSGKKVNVVRLTYRQGVPSARVLSASKLQEMMREPLLRSTGVLGGLFHEGAIVCEGDSDRVFYQEINERMLAFGRQGTHNSLFLNAQNKQTVRRIVRPLREVGIPAAAIVDLDILKKDDFKELLRACFVPQALVNSWGSLKGELNRKLKNKHENYAYQGGHPTPRCA